MARTTIRTEDITASAVTSAKIAAGAVDTSGLEDDIALLGFRVASNGSLAKYNLVDQTVDDFQDTSGVDASASTEDIRDSSGKYYSGTTIVAGGQTAFTTVETTSWTAPTGLTAVTYLVVGGGGGAGSGLNGTYGGGGGGAGGLRTGTLSVTGDASYTVTVGAGGPGGDGAGSGGGTAGTSGGASVFSTITSAGGGKGSYGYGPYGSSGGSGGGGTNDQGALSGNTPSTSPSQGNNGGVGTGGQGGGGGGSGGVGSNGNSPSDYGGNGGAGTDLGSTFGTGVGATGWFAGGGGGGHKGDATGGWGNGGDGNLGGGGNAYLTSSATGGGSSGSDGTGGGGGAGSVRRQSDTGDPSGGDGGDGTVIVKWDAINIYNNMTLVSTTTAAQAAPTKGDIVLTYTNGAGTTTLDTDLTAEISADGGSTWTALALASEGSTGSHNIATSHDVTISSTITAPYNMAYRIKTLNQAVGKTTRIQAVSLGWS